MKLNKTNGSLAKEFRQKCIELNRMGLNDNDLLTELDPNEEHFNDVNFTLQSVFKADPHGTMEVINQLCADYNVDTEQWNPYKTESVFNTTYSQLLKEYTEDEAAGFTTGETATKIFKWLPSAVRSSKDDSIENIMDLIADHYLYSMNQDKRNEVLGKLEKMAVGNSWQNLVHACQKLYRKKTNGDLKDDVEEQECAKCGNPVDGWSSSLCKRCDTTHDTEAEDYQRREEEHGN